MIKISFDINSRWRWGSVKWNEEQAAISRQTCMAGMFYCFRN